MAKLTSSDLTLEIRFRDYELGALHYETLFLWQDEPIISDSVISRHTKFLNDRSAGAFKAHQNREDDLIPVLGKLIETNEPSLWKKSNLQMVIWPDEQFPLTSLFEFEWKIAESSRAGKSIREFEKTRESDILGESMTFFVFVDRANFRGGMTPLMSNTGEGIVLLMRPTKAAVGQFLADLSKEYALLRQTADLSMFEYYEAREWLQTNANPSPFAGNRFSGREEALAFVEQLYAAGAAKVHVTDLHNEPWRTEREGGPYSATLVIELPTGPPQRQALFQIYNQEAEDTGGFEPQNDTGQSELGMWWD